MQNNKNQYITADMRRLMGDKTEKAIATAGERALLAASKAALADLEGIMPEFEPSGDRQHPAWQTIKELRAAIAKEESAA